MRAGNDSHTTIFRSTVVYRKPEGDNLHGIERPVTAVLMPEDRLTVKRRLADVVLSKQRDTGTNELLSDVEQAVIANQSHPKGILCH